MAIGFNLLRTCLSCIRDKDRRRLRVQGQPYPQVSSGLLSRQLRAERQLILRQMNVEMINLERLFPRIRVREPKCMQIGWVEFPSESEVRYHRFLDYERADSTMFIEMNLG